MPGLMKPPAGAADFLSANGWGGAAIEPLAGDASFRRYFRVVDRAAARRAVLMDAPPPEEDVRPFLRIAELLDARGFSAPRALAADVGRGLLLLEDYGDRVLGPALCAEPGREREAYELAVDVLVELGRERAPADVPPYEEAVLRREAGLLTEWYMPAAGLDRDEDGYHAAWDPLYAMLARAGRAASVLVLRDYHADNLMLLDRPGLRSLGLLDFQDALAGHPAYDLVSLLQDARRDVPPELEEAMIARFLRATGQADEAGFRAIYEMLGAQRNAKILGIFTRLSVRDGKRAYPAMHPRIWGYLERNLQHPALAPVAAWFERRVPAAARGAAVAERLAA